MTPKLKIGFFSHFFQPQCRIADYLKESRFECEVQEIDFKKPRYLEEFDVIIIEQNGFNDYIENDSDYFNDYIKRGGICWIMHQDHRRWSPYFLPDELGHPFLVNRYFETIRVSAGAEVFFSYMMPDIEPTGDHLFSCPNKITTDEMIYWEIPGNSFGIVNKAEHAETILSSAISCLVNADKWEILGSYRDAAIQNGALISQTKYGKGLFFWNQILFPEEKTEAAGRAFSFWNKYIENVLCHFNSFKTGETPMRSRKKSHVLPIKNNYRMITHVHSLDWYGADASLAAIRAAMLYHKFDIGILAVKDAAPYGGTIDTGKYSDEHVLLLPGQEFHPFNWTGEKTANGYHLLSMGEESYAPFFTKSLFSRQEVDSYLEKALSHIRENGGVSCATHPDTDFWKNHDLDAVDIPWNVNKPAMKLNAEVENFYLSGGRITTMVSVDMWGVQRLKSCPVFNFIYLDGAPSRSTVLSAIKKGHVMAALRIDAADIRWGDYLPGDTLPGKDASRNLEISLTSGKPLNELRIYSWDTIIHRETLNSEHRVERRIPLPVDELRGFVRVEIEGVDAGLASNPFYLTPKR